MVIHNDLVEKIERMSKLVHFILVEWSTTATMMSPLLIALINYFVLGMGDESFRFDGTIWLPFDTNSSVGFFATLLFQTVAVFAAECFLTPVVCLFIGSCWCIVAFLKDIATDVSTLRERKILHLNEQKLTERFYNFVRFHADVEELSVDIPIEAVSCRSN